MSVLRSTTFQLAVKTGDGTTQMRSFMRSVSDADKTVAKLNEELGENVTATYKTVQSSKELTAQARMTVTALEKANRSYSSQTELMNHQLSLIGKSEAQQAALNAQFKLGASATDEQRQALGELASKLATVQQEEAQVNAESEERIRNEKLLVAQQEKETKKNETLINQYSRMNQLMTEYNGDLKKVNAVMQLGSNATKKQVEQLSNLIDANRKLTTTQGKTQGSMRGLRGQAQNLGWQMQDVAVQMQMGTDAMVIFSQQGSQVASGFGPGGAVLGAVIAVGGAIAGYAVKALTGAESLKELEEAQKLVNLVFDDGATKASTLTSKYRELFEKNKALAILTAKQARNAASEIRNESMAEARKLASEHFTLVDTIKKDFGGVGKLEGEALQRLIDKELTIQGEALGVTLDQMKELNEMQSLMTSTSTLAAYAEMASKTSGVKNEMVDLGLKAGTVAQTIEDQTAIIEEYNKLKLNDKLPDESGGGGGTSKIVSAFLAEYNRTIKQTETINQEYERRKDIIDQYVMHIGGINSESADAYAKLEQWKTFTLNAEEVKRSQIAQKAIEDERKRRQKVLDTANKKIGNNLTDPVLAEEQRFNDTLKPLIEERNNLQSWEHDERKKIDALMERENARHAEAMTSAQLQQASTIVGAVSIVSASMTSSVDLLATGAEDIAAQMENMNEAQKAMFIFNQGIAATEAVINGISLGMKLAEAFPLAALPLLEFGTGLGVAQAGIIMGTTFAGAFDEGGVIPAGQKGVVAEYGDELVGGTMVYNNSSSGLGVTGREDTAKMMNGGGIQFNINNTASGIVDVTGSQIDENTVDIKIAQYFSKNIDAGVAGVFNKPSSKTSKTYNKNYRANRKVK